MRIGLALGGGGVRGLAHILVIQAIEEFGVKPDIVSGTSIGSIVGAMYTSGKSPHEMIESVRLHTISNKDSLRDVFAKKHELLKWADILSPGKNLTGVVDAAGFIHSMLDEIHKTTFEELEIPLRVIAADYWSAEEIVFESGSLLPAIQASMAVPGVFSPVPYEGRVLVDGGVVNLVPYDRVQDDVDLTIAVNVGKSRTPGEKAVPSALDAVLGTFSVMQEAALLEKMKKRKPDIYVKPEISGVRMLEFNKIDDVLAQAMPAIEQFKQQFSELLS